MKAEIKKITSVSHYFYPHIGGLEIVALQQVRSLVGDGNKVSVITFASVGEKSGVEVVEDFKINRLNSVNFFDKYFGIPFPFPTLLTFFSSIKVFSGEIKSSDFVHVHDVFYVSSWLAYYFSWKYNKKIFLTQHVGLVSHTNPVVVLIQKLVYSLIGVKIFKYSTNIIVYNGFVKQFLIDKGVSENKIIQLFNGIDTEKFKPVGSEDKIKLRKKYNLPTDRPLVMFVGRFVPKKGFDLLLKAWDETFDLVFVGSGNFPEEFKKNNRIHFLGSKTQSELVEVYNMADIFACPSNGEIFTLVMQEALSSGLPVITTDETDYLKYDINRENIAFVKLDSHSINNKIKEIIFNKQLAKKMSLYSREIACKLFDWNKNTEKILELYRSNYKMDKERKVFVTTSWDDGHKLDFKLADLMKKYNITGTFYVSPKDREIPVSDRLTDEEIIKLSNGFEIGAHTFTHPKLTGVVDSEAKEEIFSSKKYLEELLKKEVKGFCYPKGAFNFAHKKMVIEAGYEYGRGVERFSFGENLDRFAMKTTVHTYHHWSDAADIWKHSKGIIKFIRNYLYWDELALDLFDQVFEKGGVYHLWGHSWEVDNNKDWDKLERVFNHISNKPGVKYITNSEIPWNQ